MPSESIKLYIRNSLMDYLSFNGYKVESIDQFLIDVMNEMTLKDYRMCENGDYSSQLEDIFDKVYRQKLETKSFNSSLSVFNTSKKNDSKPSLSREDEAFDDILSIFNGSGNKDKKSQIDELIKCRDSFIEKNNKSSKNVFKPKVIRTRINVNSPEKNKSLLYIKNYIECIFNTDNIDDIVNDIYEVIIDLGYYDNDDIYKGNTDNEIFYQMFTKFSTLGNFLHITYKNDFLSQYARTKGIILSSVSGSQLYNQYYVDNLSISLTIDQIKKQENYDDILINNIVMAPLLLASKKMTQQSNNTDDNDNNSIFSALKNISKDDIVSLLKNGSLAVGGIMVANSAILLAPAIALGIHYAKQEKEIRKSKNEKIECLFPPGYIPSRDYRKK